MFVVDDLGLLCQYRRQVIGWRDWNDLLCVELSSTRSLTIRFLYGIRVSYEAQARTQIILIASLL